MKRCLKSSRTCLLTCILGNTIRTWKTAQPKCYSKSRQKKVMKKTKKQERVTRARRSSLSWAKNISCLRWRQQRTTNKSSGTPCPLLSTNSSRFGLLTNANLSRLTCLTALDVAADVPLKSKSCQCFTTFVRRSASWIGKVFLFTPAPIWPNACPISPRMSTICRSLPISSWAKTLTRFSTLLSSRYSKPRSFCSNRRAWQKFKKRMKKRLKRMS